ncbi:hypothetical protein R1sor_002697 [Riccia sorocarpa]|uniref:Uncharacterized protein n=1 Tax=Riccia sorocarpa TaxID=122646 RepID=A0ABD3GZH9_9MARC
MTFVDSFSRQFKEVHPWCLQMEGLSASHGHNGRTPRLVSESDLYGSPASGERYETYSRLQASAVAFDENLPIPEIVAVGGQSDGKLPSGSAIGIQVQCQRGRDGYSETSTPSNDP